MRSPIYYGARGFAREINRQRNQYQRSIEAEHKKALKEEMYNNGYEFEQKENRRLEKKKQMCFNYAAIMIKQNPYFDFELLKEKYIPAVFDYEKEPEYIDRASNIFVPEEKKLEKIFKSLRKNRIKKEIQKQNQIDADKKDFEERKEFYEINREIALNKFKKEEKKKQESIEKQNKNIDEFKRNYFVREEEAQKKYLTMLMTNYLNEHETKMFSSINLDYTSESKILIVEIEMNDVIEYFEFSHCKYLKSKNEIASYYYKDSEIKKEFTILLPKIAFGFTNLFLGNDLNDSIDNIIVNIIYNEIYLVSLNLSKKEFVKLNFDNLENFDKLNSNIRLFKSLQTGIKPYNK